jgi:phage terminase large subunit
MSEIVIKHTNVFKRNWNALLDDSIRFIVNQGSTRSSKTYSLCQMVIVYCLNNPNKIVSIVRKSFPSLRATVMRDMIDLLNEYGLYKESQHNKTDNIFQFTNGAKIEFFSLDDSQKIRGRKRDVLWANEANELGFEEFNQLNFRTTEKLFFDFNPSSTEHWLYDLLDKEDSLLVHSTYKDNTFLPSALIKEIEDLILIDQDYYNIYALGLPSKSTHTIYNHQKPYIEELIRYDDVIWGLDFGYQHPTALIKCQFREDMAFVREIIYESYLTTEDLIEKMRQLGVSKSDIIVCDYARPEIIEELRRAGYNAVNANKNVKEGIDAVKSHKVFYHAESLNISKEFRNYKWKSQGDRILDEPIKLYDDAMDAIRYAILYHKKNSRSGGGAEFMVINI